MREAWPAITKACSKISRRNLIITLITISLLMIPGTYIVNAYGPQEVTIDGKVIGVAANREVVDKALAQVMSMKSQAMGGSTVELAQDLQMKRKFIVSGYADQLEMERLLAEADFVVKAASIKINGENSILVADEEAAATVLEQVKQHYLQLAPGEELKEIAFVESINIEPTRAEVDQILLVDEAVEQIMRGTEQMVSYTVQAGDCLWTIARENDLRVADLLAANELESEDLDLGQVLNLTCPTPLINVRVTVEKKVTESIDFPVEVKETDERLRGFRKVEQQGKPGSREVIYQIVRQNELTMEENILAEQIIQEPVKQVVLQGTGVLLASRGSSGSSVTAGGSGRLAWPLRGSITSRYGSRSGGFHTGMDINGNTGDSIRAAEDGKVTEAGWGGGYGKMVVVDHGGGVLTRYAHCSSLNVKVGDRVTQGEVIARVGSTGRSTGSHLHFEVITGGKTVNPAKYLR